MNKFAERLKQVRLEKGLYQRDIGDALELSDSAIATYEKGSKQPTLNGFIGLCKYLDVSADFLLGFSDDPKRK